ncbi:MAG: RtcB family protein [Spirochaetaceae bacterium]|nr:RtcB family protein [Spirochaetaceae bacterium]
MIEIKGAHNSALCYCDELDEKASEQIKIVCDQAEFAESKIRIMPDVHAGKGCTIGTTMTITNKIVPGMVGVDIGCGMETAELSEREINYEKLEKVIRTSIPAGRKIRDNQHPFNSEINLTKLRCARKVDLNRARHSIGTLGGGNHFIEIDRADNGTLYVVIHSGSRHIGTEVADHYQKEACKQLSGSSKAYNGAVPKDLAYVSGDLFNDYIHDMKIIQLFAVLNRKAMMDVILSKTGLTKATEFTTIHNYIDMDSMILRKGAVSAKKGEKLLIPINMRDGSLICIGKGNNDWNQSAPHGAGRIMSRTAALRELSMEKYRAEMAGIFTTCVGKDTLDESPMAYKSMESIISQITPTAEIILHIKPVYNFKAGE